MKINWSEPGVPISIMAHAGLLVASLVVMSSAKPFADAQEAIPVEMVTADQFTAMVKGEKTAKDVKPTPAPRVEKIAEKEDPKPTHGPDAVDAPTPPARAPEISETPPAPPLPPTRPPEPAKPEPQKVAEPPKPEPPKEVQVPKPPERPQPQKDAEIPKPPERPQPPKHEKPPEPPKVAADKPKEKPPQFDKIAQLLAEKKTEEPRKPSKPPAKEKGEPSFSTDAIEKLLVSREKPKESGSSGAKLQRTASLGTHDGHAPKLSLDMTQALIGWFSNQMNQCFDLTVGTQFMPGTVFRARVSFNPDGSLIGRPQVTATSSDPAARVGAEAVARGIMRCAPYHVPAQFAPYFDQWRDTVFQIDPKDIVG